MGKNISNILGKVFSLFAGGFYSGVPEDRGVKSHPMSNTPPSWLKKPDAQPSGNVSQFNQFIGGLSAQTHVQEGEGFDKTSQRFHSAVGTIMSAHSEILRGVPVQNYISQMHDVKNAVIRKSEVMRLELSDALFDYNQLLNKGAPSQTLALSEDWIMALPANMSKGDVQVEMVLTEHIFNNVPSNSDLSKKIVEYVENKAGLHGNGNDYPFHPGQLN